MESNEAGAKSHDGREGWGERRGWEDSGWFICGTVAALQHKHRTQPRNLTPIWQTKRDTGIKKKKKQMKQRGSDQREDHRRISNEMVLTAKVCGC
jgi:hypothetical protein